jgi:hypothetical protein
MRRGSILTFLVLIVAVVYWYSLPRHKTPLQQAPLADLTDESLPRFKADFNGSAAALRIVILLSPT